MKTPILALTAVLLATTAHADNHEMNSYKSGTVNEASMGKLIRSRDITGGDIYTMTTGYDEGAWNETGYYNAMGDGWKEIGEIEDIVLSRDGKMTGIVAEVGGFLDIGDSHVLIRVEDVRLVAVDDREYAFVTRLTEEQLEALPEVDEGWWD